MLHAIIQSASPMQPFVARRRIGINPHLAIYDNYRKGAHVVGEGIERTTACQVKAGVMPVAGENSIFNTAPIQGKTHVGTSIVHGADLSIMVEHGNCVAPTSNHGTAALL